MFKSMTFDMIKSVLDDDAYEAFNKWMRGQTVGLRNGKQVVYSHDFERWVHQSIHMGMPVTSQSDDWD